MLHIVGPLLWYDLARLARRGRTSLLRFVYGCFLLGLLYYVFRQRFPGYHSLGRAFDLAPALPPSEWTRFAFQVVSAVIALQGAAIFVVAPAYLAHAVAEERERGTLELLFTTPLLDREIVLGKLLGRLAHLVNVLLTALPILCVVQLWGGVDGRVLLAAVAVTGLTLLSVGSVSMLCSVNAPNVLTAVVSSYALVTILGFFCLALPASSPLSFLGEFDSQYGTALKEWGKQVANLQRLSGPGRIMLPSLPDVNLLLLTLLIPVALVHLAVFALCVFLSIVSLRAGAVRLELPGRSLPQRVRIDEASWGPFEEPKEFSVHQPAPTVIWSHRPPVTDQALLWKEAVHGAIFNPGRPPLEWLARYWRVLCFSFVSLALYAALIARCFPEMAPLAAQAINFLVRLLSMPLIGLWLIGVAFRSATGICREREKKTLEGLLLLPVERSEILNAKWLGGILRLRPLGYSLAILWFLGLATGALHPWSVLLLAGSCATYLALLASLGTWLSLESRNTLWANLSMSLIVLVFFFSPLLTSMQYGYGTLSFHEPQNLTEGIFEVGVNPIRSLWFCGFSWFECASGLVDDSPSFRLSLSGVLIAQGAFALVALGFWLQAYLRFRHEAERRRT